MNAGELRHRITVQKKDKVQNPITGEIIYNWVNVWEYLPAKIQYLSVREFIAASAPQSKITARITIRYRDNLDAEMRILHRNKIYNIQGLLPDNDSGLEYITIPVSEGTNDG